jgi:tRNA dimethylallyltransferase
MYKQQAKKLICILGPTAVGKTAISIALAKHLHTHIISADSRQFYKELSIGTAKPSANELAEAPHHFIGHISIHQKYSAGDFERDALKLLNELFKEQDTIVAVGGSGLYVKALLEGLDKMPEGDEQLRDELNQLLETKGIVALQERLLRISAESAAAIDMNNTQRVMRAIEIAEGGGLSKNSLKQPRPFETLEIILNRPREILYNRINKRVDEMIAAGLIDEAKHLFTYKDLYALQTVGYTELFDAFEGRTTIEQATTLIKQHSRNYAKRQITWFKRQPNAHWFEPEQLKEIFTCVESFIKQ